MDVKQPCFLCVLIFVLNCAAQQAIDPKKYLYQYGYLTSLEVVDDFAMVNALKKFQKSAGLSQTGILDKRTVKMMEKPRCGMGFQTRGIVPPSAKDIWHKNLVTYKIKNWSDSLNGFFNQSEFKQVLEEAIQQWTHRAKLTIQESTNNNADLNLHFKTIGGLSLGYSYPPENGSIYLDSSKNLTLHPFNEDQAYVGWLVAHELGHAIGLNHTPTTRSVMFPMYNTDTIGPSMLDVNNVVALYGGEAGLNNDILCAKMAVDAMLNFNEKNLWITGGYYWTFNSSGLNGGPFGLSQFFPDGPDQVDVAFAVGNVVFIFSGNVSYRYERRSRKKVKSIKAAFKGVPSDIDAAFYHSKGRKIHFFKKELYYQYDTQKNNTKKLLIGGAAISKYWEGIPVDLDAATMVAPDKVLFVKKLKCFLFDMALKKVVDRFDCGEELLKCSSD